jgi:hypothetical protein
MAKKWFLDKNMRADSLKRIEQCNEIIDDYLAQGLRLTLRQLYYQLVSRNIIPNVEKSYKNLSTLVSDARLAGLMDWAAIEDRGRTADTPSEFTDLADLARAASNAYRLPRWKDQQFYVELWVEKQALAGVLEPIASEHHVTLMVNKGYSSQSAMYESANRFNRVGAYRRKICLYLGDHDPSGEDMVRDIRDRLSMFRGTKLLVTKVALTMSQIEEYDPPPNPAKITDPRAAKYIEQHGDESWEVDALPPNVLTQLITEGIEKYLDRDAYDAVVAQEEDDKERLRDAVEAL